MMDDWTHDELIEILTATTVLMRYIPYKQGPEMHSRASKPHSRRGLWSGHSGFCWCRKRNGEPSVGKWRNDCVNGSASNRCCRNQYSHIW